MHAQDRACMCMIMAACACWFLRAHAEGSFGFLFQKYIYLLIKSYTFHFNIS